MNYEAVIIDPERGHHRRGTGPNPVQAVMKAFRAILRHELPESEEAKVDNLGPNETVATFRLAGISDEDLNDLKTLNEDVNDVTILVRVDRTKENMFMPCGWVRPVF